MPTKKQLDALKRGRQKLAERRARETAAIRGSTPTVKVQIKETTMAATKKKKRSTSTTSPRKATKKGRRRGRRVGGFTARDAIIAGGVALVYGLAQYKAEKAKGDEMKWFKEAPTVGPIGRAGTIAGVLGGVAYAWPKSRFITVPAALGMTIVTAVQLGRRGVELYGDKEKNAIMSGADEAQLGGARDVAMSGSLTLESGGPNEELFQRLNAA